MGKTDRRIKYTKMALRQSLLELMKTKPVEKITITQICANADINRATFYMHYDSVADLLHQLQNELYDSISLSVEKALKYDVSSILLLGIFQEIAANGDLCKVLFSKYGDTEFVKKVVNIARQKILLELKTTLKCDDKRQLNLIYSFIVNGCVGILQDWLENDLRDDPQQIAHLVFQITAHIRQGNYRTKTK